MKRFYKTARVVQTPEGWWQISLDGNALKTPATQILTLPSANLAAAIATEWSSQGEVISIQAMPLTRLAATAVDKIRPQRVQVIQGLLTCIETDLLRYASLSPQGLYQRQQSLWQPLLDWVEAEMKVKLEPTTGLVSKSLTQQDKDSLKEAINNCSDFALVGIAEVAHISSSVIIGLALLRGRLDVESAYNALFLEELWQAETWGDDSEASQRRASVKGDLIEVAQFLQLLQL